MQPKTIAVIASSVLLAALGSLWFTLRSPQPQVNRSIFTSLGQVLAQATATAIHDRGQVVAVVAECYAESGNVVHDQWRAFAGELKKYPSISLAAPELIQPGQHTPLVEILERHPQASTIVFFVDPPGTIDLEAVASRPAVPPLVLVGNPDLPAKNYYGRFIASGLLAAVIIPRSFPAVAPPAQPKTPREWFDQHYQVYSPQNFDTLPD